MRGEEICAYRWPHVGEGGYGVGVANATVYGHDVVRDRDLGGPMTVVRETLLRSPLFPDPETDQGTHSFLTVLAPGADIPRTVSLGYEVTFLHARLPGDPTSNHLSRWTAMACSSKRSSLPTTEPVTSSFASTSHSVAVRSQTCGGISPTPPSSGLTFSRIPRSTSLNQQPVASLPRCDPSSS